MTSFEASPVTGTAIVPEVPFGTNTSIAKVRFERTPHFTEMLS